MEYINIISKEAMTAIPDWQGLVIIMVCMLLILVPIIYLMLTGDIHKATKILLWTGTGAICFEVVALCICSAFFREPTGRYKYEATIDKEKITVNQYEEFIEKYNPIIKDGVYYWEE